MKKFVVLVAIIATLFACKDVDEDEVINPDYNVSFDFTQNWDGTELNNSDFETTEFTNANGDVLTISKLNYLISNVTFTSTSETGETIFIEGHNLVNSREGLNLHYNLDQEIPEGEYTVSFTFGLNSDYNIDGAYPDLTSANWGVPTMLGGGYHYMRLEGTFIDETGANQGYQYHTIHAVENPGDNPQPEDTSFEVSLGNIFISNDTDIEVKMNVAEWFRNPNQWDLNELNNNLMMNAEAQRMMSANGKSVFSLGLVADIVE